MITLWISTLEILIQDRFWYLLISFLFITWAFLIITKFIVSLSAAYTNEQHIQTRGNDIQSIEQNEEKREVITRHGAAPSS